MIIRSIAFAALAAAAAFTASPVWASTRCEVKDGETRLTEQQAREKLTEAGYKDIRSVGTEDGCWEGKVVKEDGKRAEVYLHPVTGAVVKVKEK